MQQKNNDKLSDKAFVRLVMTSILGIVVCLVCLCSTTWAWFSDSTPSNNNEIKTANKCLLTISVYNDDAALENIENGVILENDIVYTVSLMLPKDSASGYCVIETDTTKYYTGYIARHENDEAQTLTFTLTVENTQEVKFKNHWGIYSGETHVGNNGQLHIN